MDVCGTAVMQIWSWYVNAHGCTGAWEHCLNLLADVCHKEGPLLVGQLPCSKTEHPQYAAKIGQCQKNLQNTMLQHNGFQSQLAIADGDGQASAWVCLEHMSVGQE